ncbi:bacteriorhodopsin [Natronorubrum sp. JWXQ-INN-674]|uniref:Bacteriorhodopsin n=1 Tax=Natronorubrum halalkaliphilum TaxID=2691917 RepID=A0A6B0VLZ7_9EURY|nr:bacteriorhodopsin [Natronorubrum halalkaliphilum]MXV61792.1 bacteriorhodopsin [Natronorubrum halalkaliphilum]
MIEQSTVLAVSAVVLGVLALVFLLWTRRVPTSRRRYGYAATLAAGAMSGTYLIMSLELLTVSTSGTEESVARFLGYSIVWATISYVLGAVSDAGRRYTLALFACSMLTLWTTFAGWVLGETGATLASVGTLAAFVGLVYLLLGPVARTAASVSGERLLLYDKLKNLVLLAWFGLIVLGLISQQNLALTDGFVGQVAATYIDVVLLAGFGGLVLRSGTALEQTAASTELFSELVDTGEADADGSGLDAAD